MLLSTLDAEIVDFWFRTYPLKIARCSFSMLAMVSLHGVLTTGITLLMTKRFGAALPHRLKWETTLVIGSSLQLHFEARSVFSASMHVSATSVVIQSPEDERPSRSDGNATCSVSCM